MFNIFKKKTPPVVLRNCNFSFVCNADWDSMTPSASNGKQRFCDTCNKQVFFCSTDEELAEHVRDNDCIAIFEFGKKENSMLIGEVS
jgi:hypothetical protein